MSLKSQLTEVDPVAQEGVDIFTEENFEAIVVDDIVVDTNQKIISLKRCCNLQTHSYSY